MNQAPSVIRVRSSSDWNEFLRFPWKVYGEYPQWVPPILAWQRRDLKRRKAHFFTDGFGSDAEFFLAIREGRTVGRIAAIRNERHLRRHRDDVGFFGFFESIDDTEVAAALLEAAETWLADRGLGVSRGPADFSIYDPAGVVMAGGDLRPSIGMAFTPPYYARLLESWGYFKAKDLYAYRLAVEDFDDGLMKYERTLRQFDLEGQALDIREVRPENPEEEAALFAGILTSAWQENWGAIPMLPEDFLHASRELGPFFDKRLCYVAQFEGKPVGIFLAIADPWEIFHHLDGRLGIRGRWQVLRGRSRIRNYRVIMMGVSDAFRNGPVASMMLREFQSRWKNFPAMKTIEISWILEDNLPARGLAEACGARPAQIYRLYDKFIG